MYYGADYYPEHWPEDRWATDAALMKEAGLNIVRLAEFAWAKMEPEEGVFDFSWLDRAIDTLAAQGIRVVLGTPTATPPKWLHDKYPDIYPVDEQGRVFGFGIRQQYCKNNETFREYTRRIILAMANHYKDHPAVAAWQTDNELCSRCYCETCRKAFQLWLRRRYKTIDRLNVAWGTVFWSQTYRSFEEVIVPRAYQGDGSLHNHNPGLLLDYYRFNSDSVVDYQNLQLELLRSIVKVPVTHNFMGHYSELDYYNLARNLDFISWDNYPAYGNGAEDYPEVAMAHETMRGLKNSNFWIMEQQSGPSGWQTLSDTPQPGQLRLWAWQSVAHGADAVIYFRWRACTFGREQYWYGILDHDGKPRRRYREVAQTGAELHRLESLLLRSAVAADVAIVKSYDNVWSHSITPHNGKFDYSTLLQKYFRALARQSINANVVSVEQQFTPYKLVVMPAFDLMTEEIRQKCEQYVAAGGALLVTFRSGTRLWDSRMATVTLPGAFGALAGVEVEEFDSLNHGRQVKVTGAFGEGKASIWCDVLNLCGAKPLAEYASHFYSGKPAVTVHNVGRGQVFYIGCDLDDDALKQLMAEISLLCGLRPVLTQPVEGVEAVRKNKDGHCFLMLLNHNGTAVKVNLDGCYQDALTGETVDGSIELAAFGVAVLE